MLFHFLYQGVVVVVQPPVKPEDFLFFFNKDLIFQVLKPVQRDHRRRA